MKRRIDTKDAYDLERLMAAIEDSKPGMKTACENRMQFLRRVVGPLYPGDDGGKKERRPLNYLEFGLDIYLRNLASHEPQAMVSTDYEELWPTAYDFETVLNRKLGKMNLTESMAICVIEAMVTIGVMCIGVAYEGKDSESSVFAEPVLLPDLILDLSAKSWDEMAFVGHRFVVPLEWISEHEGMDDDRRDRFVKYVQNKQQQEGVDWNRRKSQGFKDLVELQQIWLRHENRILILPCDGDDKSPLLDEEWTGPATGPYRKLSFRTIPGNVFPLAPVINWADLDDFINKSFRKIMRQVHRSKTLGLAVNDQDAEAINGGSDGETVAVTDLNTVTEKSYGGADEKIASAVNLASQLLNMFGGNWNLLGGTAPSSKTVGQDQLLSQGASGRMVYMQEKMEGFETEVINDIGFWVWDDPAGEEIFTKRLEGTPFGEQMVWSPETRQGDFYQLNLKVNPYRKIKRTPSEQADFLIQFLERVILPCAPHMQDPNTRFDWEFFFKMCARYENAPEINMLINSPGGESMPTTGPQRSDQPTMQRNTTRRYERVNTQGGNADPLQAAMDQFVASSAKQPQMAS